MEKSGICKTKYPVLLLHGVGFRDYKKPVYWGRIPETLSDRGAELFYGLQDSWGSIEDNAAFLAGRIDEILKKTGSEKINIIAHSKGGLEARYLISTLGYEDKIASAVFASTPHRGVKTIDRLVKMPRFLFGFFTFVFNVFWRIMGDKKPDFARAMKGFTTEEAEKFNLENPDSNKVYYRSLGSIAEHTFSDMLLPVRHALVSEYDGTCDGMVGLWSMEWKNFTLLESYGYRGLSHLDMTDFEKRKIRVKCGGKEYPDICAVYADIVSELKDMGF